MNLNEPYFEFRILLITYRHLAIFIFRWKYILLVAASSRVN